MVPITYNRFKASIIAFGKYPSEQYDNVIGSLKLDKELAKAFMIKDRNTDKDIFISDKAIRAWFNHIRYWNIVDRIEGKLTEKGKDIYNNDFDRSLEIHLRKEIESQGYDLDGLLQSIHTGHSNENNLPTLDNWYRKWGTDYPKTRFKQLVQLLIGMNRIVKRQHFLFYEVHHDNA
ncbi:hypothetical protein VA7868_01931 [Vibrio aerogenes CECT 7868]|uniref:Uncharacterized protein n=1 Tax=Vibrio aerogenes CECT 7868 TaxID=1216006 RepID=A0A1M5YRK0_9VIBR|nr:hypothetical protein [Vibrio aerogenes]SHI14682.1 hypothetical protein VA7868_01931 [Vibrio aerogenes CECT 7868]